MSDTLFAQPVDRPLTSTEYSLVQWMLEHAPGDNAVYLDQLKQARVCGLCLCGCPTIDLAVAGVHSYSGGMETLADFHWRSEAGHLNGIYVFAREKRLSGLELWSIDAGETPNALPRIEELVLSVSTQA